VFILCVHIEVQIIIVFCRNLGAVSVLINVTVIIAFIVIVQDC